MMPSFFVAFLSVKTIRGGSIIDGSAFRYFIRWLCHLHSCSFLVVLPLLGACGSLIMSFLWSHSFLSVLQYRDNGSCARKAAFISFLRFLGSFSSADFRARRSSAHGGDVLRDVQFCCEFTSELPGGNEVRK